MNLVFGSKPGDPNWDPDCDLNGDNKVRVDDLLMVVLDYPKNTEKKDGSYSWYINGTGDYYMEQWLCDHDVHALKGQQVTFSFQFKPDGIGNNATAKIHYVRETSNQTISGNWTYGTTVWYDATVTTTLPADTIAIKAIIDFKDNFKTWIDKTNIVTS